MREEILQEVRNEFDKLEKKVNSVQLKWDCKFYCFLDFSKVLHGNRGSVNGYEKRFLQVFFCIHWERL